MQLFQRVVTCKINVKLFQRMGGVMGGANSLIGYCSYLHAAIIRVNIHRKHGRIELCICVSKLCRNSYRSTRVCNVGLFYHVSKERM